MLLPMWSGLVANSCLSRGAGACTAGVVERLMLVVERVMPACLAVKVPTLPVTKLEVVRVGG